MVERGGLLVRLRETELRAAFFGVLARRFTCRSQGWPGSSCTISPCVTNDMGGKTAIADLNDVALNGRRVSLRKLLEMASDTTVSETVRLAAIREALDRAELAAQTCAPSSMAGQSGG